MAKLTINKIEKIMSEMFVPNVIVDWHGEQITIKRSLTLEEMLTFTENVIDSCFNDGEYMPQLKDFATRVATLFSYVDINLPSNTGKKYAICYQTDLVQTVLKNIDINQYTEMINAIEYKLDNMAEANVQMVYRKADDAAEAITGMVEKINTMFEDIEPQDLKNVISAIGTNGVDEKKIVNAYLNASGGKE